MFAGHLAPPIAAGIYGSHDLHQHVAAPSGQLPLDEEGAIGLGGGVFFMPLDALLGSRQPLSPLRFRKSSRQRRCTKYDFTLTALPHLSSE